MNRRLTAPSPVTSPQARHVILSVELKVFLQQQVFFRIASSSEVHNIVKIACLLSHPEP